MILWKKMEKFDAFLSILHFRTIFQSSQDLTLFFTTFFLRRIKCVFSCKSNRCFSFYQTTFKSLIVLKKSLLLFSKISALLESMDVSSSIGLRSGRFRFSLDVMFFNCWIPLAMTLETCDRVSSQLIFRSFMV